MQKKMKGIITNTIDQSALYYHFENKEIQSMLTLKGNEFVHSQIFAGLSICLKDIFEE